MNVESVWSVEPARLLEFEFLEKQLRRHESLLAQSPVTIYVCKPNCDLHLTYVSNSTIDFLGYPAEEFLESFNFWGSHIHPEDMPLVLAGIARALLGETVLLKYRFKLKTGEWKWMRDRPKLIVDSHGQPVEIIGAWTDITELIKIEDALRQSEEKHRLLLENVHAGVLVHAKDGTIIYSNKHASDLLGLTSLQLIGRSSSELEGVFLQEHDESPMASMDFPANKVLSNSLPVNNMVIGITTPTAVENKWIIANAFPELDHSGAIRNVVVTMLDITDRFKSQEKIYHLAHYDALTQLPNRSLIIERIEQTINLSLRDKKKFSLLFLDLDDFKLVNDSLGHHVGDFLLQRVAERIKDCLREGDSVGRIAGDEFVALLPGTGSEGASSVAKKILEAIETPFNIGNNTLTNYASIGISVYPADGQDSDTLTRHADIAMYQAKQSGRGSYAFFDPEMNLKIERRVAMERDLRHALEFKEFHLYYQPQIDVKTGMTSGLEALIRWRHPERGMISPVEFIPLAEETGLIGEIGEWVMQQVGHDLKTWQDAGLPRIIVAINISLRQLRNPNLFDLIASTIQKSGVSPELFELELTESVMMENSEVVLLFMERCRSIGVNFSIDDFGTGYSSLSYLHKLPLDKLKIDRAFIKDIACGSDANLIVAAIISMAKSLHLKVVAEGVETAEQLQFLSEHGCDTIQGYYFSRPLDYLAITQFLNQAQK